MRRITFSLLLLFGCANATKTAGGDDAGSGSDVQPKGRTGHGFVAGGVVAKSASYKLIGTLTAGQGTGTSTHYSQHAGVLGSTQP